MNAQLLRNASGMQSINSMVRAALRAEAGIENAEQRNHILALAGQSLVYDDGDTYKLSVYLRVLAVFAEVDERERYNVTD